ncbi:MAG: helix-turn-helix domain-containing protein [Micromonosporaceae bacterium]|nr:helix-turn-helix domain-containing protein [Micromonosporaceae bacterium]
MYREWPYALDGAVAWSRAAAHEDRVARILPDGCIDLIWSQGRVMVAGPDTTARLVRTPAGVEYVAVRFAPGLAPGVLGVPAHELRDRQPDLDDVWPGRGRRLAEIISESADRPRALAELIRSELARAADRTDPLARQVAQRLARGERVGDVARSVGLSPRQLHRRSLDAFGYGPKTLARVLRLNRALALARTGATLADVAATTGYADQAHFAREVRALTGTTAAALLAG